MSRGLLHKDVEIKRAEHTNEWGVTTVNTLIEHQSIFPVSGKIYKKEYTWDQYCVSSKGEKIGLTSQVARYKQYKRMEDAMIKYHFE